jgi:hypothetical protein
MATAIPLDALNPVLESLDPANDAHWTAEGLPAVAAVNAGVADLGLSGVSLTRNDLSALAPDFTRESPVLPEFPEEPADAGGDQSGGEETPPSDAAGAEDAAPSAPDSEEPSAPDASPPQAGSDPGPDVAGADAPVPAETSTDDAAEIRRRLDDLATVKQSFESEIVSLREKIREVDDADADLRLLLNRIAPPPKPAEAIQDYLRKSNAHRANAIQAAHVVAEAVRGTGVDPAEVLNRGRALAESIRSRR